MSQKLLSLRTENRCPNKNLYANIHSGVIHNSWKMVTSYRPITDEWIIKCDICIQWNITQPEKAMKYWFMLWHGWNLEAGDQKLASRSQTPKSTHLDAVSIETESRLVRLRSWEKMRWEWWFNECGVSLTDSDCVLSLAGGGGWKILMLEKNHWIVHLKVVEMMTSIL